MPWLSVDQVQEVEAKYKWSSLWYRGSCKFSHGSCSNPDVQRERGTWIYNEFFTLFLDIFHSQVCSILGVCAIDFQCLQVRLAERMPVDSSPGWFGRRENTTSCSTRSLDVEAERCKYHLQTSISPNRLQGGKSELCNELWLCQELQIRRDIRRWFSAKSGFPQINSTAFQSIISFYSEIKTSLLLSCDYYSTVSWWMIVGKSRAWSCAS